MLIEFHVKNFLSFQETVSFSMLASNDLSSKENLIPTKHGSLLKYAAIFGANASGKSNFFKAIAFMKHFVLHSSESQESSKIDVVPFKLDEKNLDEPSTFEISFLYEDVLYQYGFSVFPHTVKSEWLYSFPEGRKRLLFERVLEQNEFVYKWGDSWVKERKKLADLTRKNALFISVASQFNHPLTKRVVNWFARKLKLLHSNPAQGEEDFFTRHILYKNGTKKQPILDLLRKADFDLTDLSVTASNLQESKEFHKLPSAVKDQLLEGLKEFSAQTLEVSTSRKGKDREGNEKNISFELNEESDGTQKYFALAGPLLYVLEKDAILLADELTLHLHPLLSQALITMFARSKSSQLIFSTHDAHFFEANDSFRRDQIWFAQKNPSSGTEMYTLWDIKGLRKNENLKKNYFAGKYGAIPFLDFERPFQTDKPHSVPFTED